MQKIKYIIATIIVVLVVWLVPINETFLRIVVSAVAVVVAICFYMIDQEQKRRK